MTNVEARNNDEILMTKKLAVVFVIPSESRGIPRRYLKAFAPGSFDFASLRSG
jgi:hypothetical protein